MYVIVLLGQLLADKSDMAPTICEVETQTGNNVTDATDFSHRSYHHHSLRGGSVDGPDTKDAGEAKKK